MTYLQVHQSASPPSPTDVGGYLLQAGWSHARTDNLWAVYSKEINDQVVEVEVPQRATALDYARSVALLLEDLSQIEGRSESLSQTQLKVRERRWLTS
jgi:hypothetical protein